MIKATGAFWIGVLLVGSSIVLFESLLWGFIIGILMGFIIITIDQILDVVGEQDE